MKELRLDAVDFTIKKITVNGITNNSYTYDKKELVIKLNGEEIVYWEKVYTF